MPREFVIFDTEYTAWEGSKERNWTGENEHKEIVQIGAIRVNNLEETNSLMVFVRPAMNPKLSDYFKDLTGIAQNDIDEEGKSLEESLRKFSEWSLGLPLYCYGYDGQIMKENADLVHARFPFVEGRFRDVREVFQEAGINVENYHSGTIPKAFGLIPPPDAHNALNDARSILIALKAI